MEFLKDILGEELFTEFKLCVENYNKENSENKINIIRGKCDQERIDELKEKLNKEKISSKVMLSLVKAGATDADYLYYKLIEKLDNEGKSLKIDDDGNLTDEEIFINGLKESFPMQFSKDNKTVKENHLETGNPPSFSRDDILKMSYKDRAKLFEENPQEYKAAMKNDI